MANQSWLDTLSGLFENPLFQFGANLAALSGRHRFGEAFGGAVAQTGQTVSRAKRQKKLEELQAEELGIRKETLGLTRQELEAKLAKEREQASAGSALMAAMANDPSISQTERLLYNYMIQKGINPLGGATGYRDQMLDISNQRLGFAQEAAERARQEAEREGLERTEKAGTIEAEIERTQARTDLTDEEKADRIFALRTNKTLPKPLTATERLTREAMNAQKNPPETPGAPATPEETGGGVLDWLGGAWQAAKNFIDPTQPNPLAIGGGTTTAPTTPLAPPAQDPAAILSGLESQLRLMNPRAREAARAQLQQMLANPALAGLHERIKGLFGQL